MRPSAFSRSGGNSSSRLNSVTNSSVRSRPRFSIARRRPWASPRRVAGMGRIRQTLMGARPARPGRAHAPVSPLGLVVSPVGTLPSVGVPRRAVRGLRRLLGCRAASAAGFDRLGVAAGFAAAASWPRASARARRGRRSGRGPSPRRFAAARLRRRRGFVGPRSSRPSARRPAWPSRAARASRRRLLGLRRGRLLRRRRRAGFAAAGFGAAGLRGFAAWPRPPPASPARASRRGRLGLRGGLGFGLAGRRRRPSVGRRGGGVGGPAARRRAGLGGRAAARGLGLRRAWPWACALRRSPTSARRERRASGHRRPRARAGRRGGGRRDGRCRLRRGEQPGGDLGRLA